LGGLYITGAGCKKTPGVIQKQSFFTVVLIFEAIVITLGILSGKPAYSLFFCSAMNLLHGTVAGWYLTQLSACVPQQYRGRVFGFGYAIGSVGSWFVNMKATAEP